MIININLKLFLLMEKSGFKAKNEAYIAEMKAYNSYINGDVAHDSEMRYSEYLDYWMKEILKLITNIQLSKDIRNLLKL